MPKGSAGDSVAHRKGLVAGIKREADGTALPRGGGAGDDEIVADHPCCLVDTGMGDDAGDGRPGRHGEGAEDQDDDHQLKEGETRAPEPAVLSG